MTNTLPGVALSDLSVNVGQVAGSTGYYSVYGSIPWVPNEKNKIECNESGVTYVVLQKNAQVIQSKIDAGEITGPFEVLSLPDTLSASMKFNQLEDGDDIGFPDELELENVSIEKSDFMIPHALPHGRVKQVFDSLETPDNPGITRKLVLDPGFKSLAEAVEGVIRTLNMEACDGTATTSEAKSAHELWLSGLFANSAQKSNVVVKALIGVDVKNQRILLQMNARCKDPMVAEAVANFI